ncbi:MAG: winged helix DNA-binding domain-containing protein [Acidimicrobiia bacterium]|nr:winged helix DNA-binding domain-containing protein [Acidimicrobiia bacterium]MCY4457582.1 winged helix DNA-binding domain-containing protein [Acidimicrobiaceae bacterium]
MAHIGQKQASLSSTQARRICLAAQGFKGLRPNGRVDRRHLRAVMSKIGLLQLDSVPVVTRTQYMSLFSRLGPYRPELLDEIAYRDDEWFEAWSHEASLLAVRDEPLLRWQKQRARRGETWSHLAALARKDPNFVDEVLAQVRHKPLTAKELVDPRQQSGQWWGGRSEGSIALDWLFRIGELGVRRRAGFQKEFDLLERIVPKDILAMPTHSEPDAQRRLLMRAAASFGVATASDLIDYYRLPKVPCKTRIAELVEDGRLIEVNVQGWNRPGLLHPQAVAARSIDVCTLLSPFDPVVWCRPRGLRLFDFDYKIEIYTPAAKRVYGYYVLPFLLGDSIVARVDLKTDRRAGVLLVQGAFKEPGHPQTQVAAGLRHALNDLTRFVGCETWKVTGTAGDLINAL